ncbi:jg21247 [Pararge aegeria aegeria]|uniref:Jg21247 protein n=1 Tax=Pararge aegeria aegeria TaxID=348720 RepID=A0A8S4RKK5_9NEOP|nr:jg21247 [Pararge aegeria aegeria]
MEDGMALQAFAVRIKKKQVSKIIIICLLSLPHLFSPYFYTPRRRGLCERSRRGKLMLERCGVEDLDAWSVMERISHQYFHYPRTRHQATSLNISAQPHIKILRTRLPERQQLHRTPAQVKVTYAMDRSNQIFSGRSLGVGGHECTRLSANREKWRMIVRRVTTATNNVPP